MARAAAVKPEGAARTAAACRARPDLWTGLPQLRVGGAARTVRGGLAGHPRDRTRHHAGGFRGGGPLARLERAGAHPARAADLELWRVPGADPARPSEASGDAER